MTSTWDHSSTGNDYDGSTVFVECPECGNYHAAPQRTDYDEALQLACREVTESTQRLMDAFKISEATGRWSTDPDLGLFCYTRANGQKAVSTYSLVGSWIEYSHSWMWGWNLVPSQITEATRRAADEARSIGELRDWPCLKYPLLRLSADGAWHITKLAAFLSRYPLVYRAKVNEIAWSYFAIGEPQWEM